MGAVLEAAPGDFPQEEVFVAVVVVPFGAKRAGGRGVMGFSAMTPARVVGLFCFHGTVTLARLGRGTARGLR